MKNLILSSAVVLIASSAAQAQIQFTVIPTDSGAFEAVSVSDAGAVVGGRLNGASALWTPTGGFEVIGGAYFRGLSGDGNAALVSGGFCFWVRDQGCVGSAPGTDTWGISRDGRAIVGHQWYDSSGCSISAIHYSRTTGVRSEMCVARCNFAYGCSDNGAVVVGRTDCNDNGIMAFKWTIDGPVVMICPGWASSADAQGRVVVGTDTSQARAFRHTTYDFGGTQLSRLEPIPGYESSEAWKVSSDGRLVLGTSTSTSATKPTLWAGDRPVDLVSYMQDRGVNLKGWNNVTARDISKDGKAIVGNGTYLGQQRSWMLTKFEPTVSGVIPVSGPAAGGTSVVINGNNFVANQTVLFGNVPAVNVQVISPTQIVATTPANLPGNCAISIDWATTADVFYYRPSCTTDANNDGVVDGSDLSILLSEWGSCQ